MDVRVFGLLLAFIAAKTAASIDYERRKVSEFVDRIKRNSRDEIHGHSLAFLHAEDPDSGLMNRLRKRDAEIHTLHPSSSSRKFAIELESGHQVHMRLTRRSVVTSATQIVQRLANNVEVRHMLPRDCFFSGPVDGASGHASISMCDGDVMGSVQTNERHYEIHSLPPEVAVRRRRSTDVIHLLVTWTDTESARESGDSRGPKKRSAGEAQGDGWTVPRGDNEDGAGHRRKRYVEEKWTEEELTFTAEDETDTGDITRKARNMSSKVVVIEVGAFMDSFFQARLVRIHGPKDLQWFVQLAVLKWNGVWTVLSDPKLGWDITVRLVHLGIWTVNPGWYNSNTAATLGERMGSICRGMKDEKYKYDQITLWTHAVSEGRIGLSWITGTCRKSYRCTVVMSPNAKFTTELHELGHSLGMQHDGQMKACCRPGSEMATQDPTLDCTNTDQPGFMGGRNAYASQCYATVFNNILTKRNCLYWEYNSHSVGEALTLITPGQKLGYDGQCQFLYGPEFTYLYNGDLSSADCDCNNSPYSDCAHCYLFSVHQPCSQFTCLASNPNKNNYGMVNRDIPLTGTPCAPGRVCKANACPSLNVTSFQAVFERNVIMDGGWGQWSTYSPCSLSTPGAAKLRVSTRKCNRPKPKYGAHCAGNPLRAKLCPSSTTAAPVDVQQLADDICTYHRKKGAKYTGEGVVGSVGDVNTCRVGCRQTDNTRPGKERFLLPDGVQCPGPDTPFQDSVTGVSRHCLQGLCTAFGCDQRGLGDAEGRVLDKCGVCKGQGDTCVHGEFNGPINEDDRYTLVILPAGATNIYIGHPYHKQTDISIEMWTKDVENEQVVLSKAKRVNYKGANIDSPINFARSLWYLDKLFQSLTAAGPIDQPVNITIFKSSTKTFQRAVYRYTPGAPTSTAMCQNGGSPLAGGCSCPQGFYGLSCEHTCSVLCQNTAPVDPATCRCVCNSSRQEGDLCACKMPYTGLFCNDCAINGCQNGGHFDPVACNCSCPVNCEGYDCSVECADTKSNCKLKRCATWLNHKEQCRKMCGFCDHDDLVNNGQCERPVASASSYHLERRWLHRFGQVVCAVLLSLLYSSGYIGSPGHPTLCKLFP